MFTRVIAPVAAAFALLVGGAAAATATTAPPPSLAQVGPIGDECPEPIRSLVLVRLQAWGAPPGYVAQYLYVSAADHTIVLCVVTVPPSEP